MTIKEYIDSVDFMVWQDEAIERARNDFARLLTAPGVMEALLEEFNNDVYDALYDAAVEAGCGEVEEE